MSYYYTDLQGNPYKLVSETKEGQFVKTDGDFTCMKKNEIKEIHSDQDGFYIECSEGHHYLDGQLHEDGEVYVGLYPV